MLTGLNAGGFTILNINSALLDSVLFCRTLHCTLSVLNSKIKFHLTELGRFSCEDKVRLCINCITYNVMFCNSGCMYSVFTSSPVRHSHTGPTRCQAIKLTDFTLVSSGGWLARCSLADVDI